MPEYSAGNVGYTVPPLPGMKVISGTLALRRLQEDYGFSEERARKILNIAWEFENKAEPCEGGYIHVFYHGWSPPTGNVAVPRYHLFAIEDHTGKTREKTAGKVAVVNATRYNQGDRMPSKYSSAKATTMRRNTMPPSRTRTRQPAAAPEPEPEVTASNGEAPDQDAVIERYLTKNLTATQEDFIEWFDDNVTDHVALGKTDPDRLMILANQTYGMFQQSDFNRDRKAERKAQRESAAAAEPEPEPEPVRPAARRGKGRPAAAPEQAAPAPARPARRTRTAASTASAPF